MQLDIQEMKFSNGLEEVLATADRAAVASRWASIGQESLQSMLPSDEMSGWQNEVIMGALLSLVGGKSEPMELLGRLRVFLSPFPYFPKDFTHFTIDPVFKKRLLNLRVAFDFEAILGNVRLVSDALHDIQRSSHDVDKIFTAMGNGVKVMRLVKEEATRYRHPSVAPPAPQHHTCPTIVLAMCIGLVTLIGCGLRSNIVADRQCGKDQSRAWPQRLGIGLSQGVRSRGQQSRAAPARGCQAIAAGDDFGASRSLGEGGHNAREHCDDGQRVGQS